MGVKLVCIRAGIRRPTGVQVFQVWGWAVEGGLSGLGCGARGRLWECLRAGMWRLGILGAEGEVGLDG